MKNYFCIGIEDLAANALIEISKVDKELNQKKLFLTYSKIEKYGVAVTEILNTQGNKAVLTLSRENTNNFFKLYSEFFIEDEKEGEKGILLSSKKEIEDLIENFRGYLSLDLLDAFISEKSIKALKE
ncbi:hypothetical protein LH398_01620 [Fusobacterium nucleatum]|uniref:hypothetical protein n=1 Tax=Fusobacterium animalis TaxID=76859 RepID=UPI0030A6F6BD